MTRNFLACASLYRRIAKSARFAVDLSHTALVAAYEYETYGKDPTDELRELMKNIFPDHTTPINGYVYGKSRLNLLVNMVKQDIYDGLFIKAEWYTGQSGWFWRRALKKAPPCPTGWLGYSKGIMK